MRKYLKIIIATIFFAAATTTCKKDKEVDVTEILLSQGASITMTVGDKITLTPTVEPANATFKEVKWKSSATDIVSVAGGALEALKPGKATITATAGRRSAKCEVTVVAATVPVTAIAITPAGNVSVEVGATTVLTATASPENATNRAVTWSSLHKNIAAVNAQTGVVTGVAAGTATIRATANDGSGITAEKNVTVNNAPTDPFLPGDFDIEIL